MAVFGTGMQSLLEGLDAAVDGRSSDGVVTNERPIAEPPRVVFVFPGQGSQWLGMGRELMTASPVFASSMRACDEAIRDELGWSAIDRLGDDESISDVEVIQPVLWAMTVGLAAVWRDWGVEPDLLIGQSMGEIAAATVSGALTVREGAEVVCRRAQLLSTLRGTGAMAFVQLAQEEARAAIGQLDGRVSVGVVSSAESCVLTGDPKALARALEPLQAQGVYCQIVPGVDYASHSPQVEVLRQELVEGLAELRPRDGEIRLHSTVHNRVITGVELDGSYWMQNLRQPVLLSPAVQAVLADEQPALFIEVSPHPVLHNAIQEAIDAAGTGAVIGSLRRDQPELGAMLSSLGAAYAAGVIPRWERLHPQARYVPVPHYPWQRKAYWPELGGATAQAAPTVSNAPVRDGLSITITGDDEIRIVRSPSVTPAPASIAAVNGSTPPALAPDNAPAVDNRHGAALSSVPALEDYLLRSVIGTLDLAAGDIDAHTPLTRVGLDSLLGEKLRRQISTELGIELQAQHLLRGRTVAQIAEQLLA